MDPSSAPLLWPLTSSEGRVDGLRQLQQEVVGSGLRLVRSRRRVVAPVGRADAQWYGSLLPRIHRFLPTGQVLEIACGYGRWTQYLKDTATKA